MVFKSDFYQMLYDKGGIWGLAKSDQWLQDLEGGGGASLKSFVILVEQIERQFHLLNLVFTESAPRPIKLISCNVRCLSVVCCPLKTPIL